MFVKVFGDSDKQLMVRKNFSHDDDRAENPYEIQYEIFNQVYITMVSAFESIQERDAMFDLFDDSHYEETYQHLKATAEPYLLKPSQIN